MFTGTDEPICGGVRQSLIVYGSGIFRIRVYMGASGMVPQLPVKLHNPSHGFVDGYWIAGVSGEVVVTVDIFGLTDGMIYHYTAHVERSSALHELARCAEDTPQSDM